MRSRKSANSCDIKPGSGPHAEEYGGACDKAIVGGRRREASEDAQLLQHEHKQVPLRGIVVRSQVNKDVATKEQTADVSVSEARRRTEDGAEKAS